MTDEPGPFRGLVLDFSGVLNTGVRESTRAWCRSEGLPADAWHLTLGEHPHGRALYRDLETGRLSQRHWNERTAAILGVAPDNLMGRAWAGVRQATRMVRLAREARAAGLTVAMLSNSFGLDPYDPYAHAGVWDLFDVAVISEREGIAKPDPRIYRLVLDRMGLPGEDCVFVDDQAANLPPARDLGLGTVLARDEATTAGKLATLLGLPPGGPARSAAGSLTPGPPRPDVR